LNVAEQSDIIIVGAGAIGLCSAFYLNEAGFSVIIVDREPEKSEATCSFGNAGMIVASHIIPLAAPGVVRQGLKWLLDPESPFSIDFRFDANLLTWLWKFKKAANQRHMEMAAILLSELGLRSRSLYEDLSKELDFNLKTKGILMLCHLDKTLEEEIKTAAWVKELGMEAKVMSREKIQSLQPGITVSAVGGVHYPLDAHIDPNAFMSRIREYLLAKGVRILYDQDVKQVEIKGQKVTAILTVSDRFEAEFYVLAAGAHSPELVNSLPVTLPMQSGKGYSLTIHDPPKMPRIPALLIESRVAMTPLENKLRIGGTMTITGTDRSINQHKINGILKSIPKYFPEFNSDWSEGVDVWVGLRPCSPDGLPYIGKFGKVKNLVSATGHAMLGISLAPITGKLVLQIIKGQKTEVNINALSPDRF